MFGPKTNFPFSPYSAQFLLAFTFTQYLKISTENIRSSITYLIHNIEDLEKTYILHIIILLLHPWFGRCPKFRSFFYVLHKLKS